MKGCQISIRRSHASQLKEVPVERGNGVVMLLHMYNNNWSKDLRRSSFLRRMI
jgi:hypothetical protein